MNFKSTIKRSTFKNLSIFLQKGSKIENIMGPFSMRATKMIPQQTIAVNLFLQNNHEGNTFKVLGPISIIKTECQKQAIILLSYLGILHCGIFSCTTEVFLLPIISSIAGKFDIWNELSLVFLGPGLLEPSI